MHPQNLCQCIDTDVIGQVTDCVLDSNNTIIKSRCQLIHKDYCHRDIHECKRKTVGKCMCSKQITTEYYKGKIPYEVTEYYDCPINENLLTPIEDCYLVGNDSSCNKHKCEDEHECEMSSTAFGLILGFGIFGGAAIVSIITCLTCRCHANQKWCFSNKTRNNILPLDYSSNTPQPSYSNPSNNNSNYSNYDSKYNSSI